jgi:hypothetical protein
MRNYAVTGTDRALSRLYRRGSISPAAYAVILILAPFLASAQSAELPLRIAGPCVVFFGPSHAERDSIARDEGLEIDDIMDDFNYYVGKVAVSLAQMRIPSESTDSRFISVKVGASTLRTFDRRTIPDPVGMILTDGLHEPQLVPGRGTDRDLLIQIKAYFRLDEQSEQ